MFATSSAVPSADRPSKLMGLPRSAIACEACRKSKVKCDQIMPCSRCKQKFITCTYREVSQRRQRLGRSRRALLPSAESTRSSAVQETSEHQQSATQHSDAREPAIPSQPSPIGNMMSSPEVAETNASIRGPKSKNVCANNSDIATSPIVLTGDDGVETSETLRQRDTRTKTFIGLNSFTDGTEFYGPAAHLSFLLELRSLASAQQPESSPENHSQNGTGEKTKSPFSADELYPDDNVVIENEYAARFAIPRTVFPSYKGGYLYAEDEPGQLDLDLELEKECIQLYFANLHVIYCFLDQKRFYERCRKEIWEPRRLGIKQLNNPKPSRFPSLYSAVLAIGALTAGEDAYIVQDNERVQSFLAAQISPPMRRNARKNLVRPSSELAHFFYACAKALLGDMFESSSLEVSQTLLLMSLFNHQALKPHAAYMCNAMSARTACAMGSTNTSDLSINTIEAIKTWWCSYSHEMELCCSLGRETFMRKAHHYPIYVSSLPTPLPRQFASPDDPAVFYCRGMTNLANILHHASKVMYPPSPSLPQEPKQEAAMILDSELLEWKQVLAGMFDLDQSSLKEQESLTKRKLMLKMRFYSARLYIHRSFLTEAVSHSGVAFTPHLQICRQTAVELITLLYDTLMNRPFFRTWFYNVMYNFQATTIILYLLVSRLEESEELLTNVQKSLEIFEAMNVNSVARKCAMRTQETFDAVKLRMTQDAAARTSEPGSVASADSLRLLNGFENVDLFQDDFLTKLLDPDVLEIFSSNTDYSGWCVDAGIQWPHSATKLGTGS